MTVDDLAAARKALLEAVAGHLSANLSPGRSEVVATFARLYARRLPLEGVAAVSAEQLAGQIRGAFELADTRGGEPIAVRAFNPTLADDGYATTGTVIETSTADSPFLVDSVTAELESHGLTTVLVLHPVLGMERDASGRIARVGDARDASARESVMHFEVDRRLEAGELSALEGDVRRVLGDVGRVVHDFGAMRAIVGDMVDAARAGGARYDSEEVEETASFLDWLLDDNFVFLGYRAYEITGGGADRAIRVTPGSGLGILRDESSSAYADSVPLNGIDALLRARIEGGDLLVVSKTNRSADVHRRARMDYIGVKSVGPDGTVTGERRLLGLFTSKAYAEPAGDVPLLRRKLQQIVASEDLVPGTHDFKAAVSLIESFPLDELLTAPPAVLRDTTMALLELQEQRKVRLFVRRDMLGRSVSLLVALPRDRFNGQLRRRLQTLFMERFHGSSVDYHLALGETDPAQIHFRIHVEGAVPDVAIGELEREVIALARTWDDRLLECLVEGQGDERGRALAATWATRFPEHYKSSTPVEVAALDIEQLEALELGDDLVAAVRNDPGQDPPLTRVHLYKSGDRANLSALMPVLEALGLDVIEEVPVRLEGGAGEIHIHDFGVLGPDGAPLDVAECGARVAACITAVWRGETESDSLDRLIVLAGLSWRQVAVLRALRTYLQRVSAGFTLEYQNEAFAANAPVAAQLVRYLELRLDPAHARDTAAEKRLHTAILSALDDVPSLDHDRILRSHLQGIDAVVRTSAFRPGCSSISFKVRSDAVPEMPKPHPLYEIYVYAPTVEGIHLRAGKIARGGIRWSDRMEDYRTEVLGLMKAQTTKNAVIVPTGSKGGFVVKRAPADPGELRAAVRDRYVTFIHGLLDVTDNLVDGVCVPPPDVRVLDDDDPYLVVAADKGTGTFSDTANAVAAETGFWLGDAFASGGSAGYDHKGLAITARGAWESVKRHFREVGRDVMREPVTVVGVGDMSGDVFGNGMLLTRHIRLIGAFDHRHVFIDPSPDAASSFAERERLFALPASSWDDYDRAQLSPGGGIWPRTAKTIDLSQQAARAIGVQPGPTAPSDVIRAMLRAPVDLLWNGGIGTYVRAAHESDADVGDRANDALRVTGGEVRALVVGEGGNLGLTQQGRIEYAATGGHINADFIDNSGGVDCSDHEVNLKILLGLAVARGELSHDERDALLAEVAEDVTRHVLRDNYLQAQILSQDAALSSTRIGDYEELMAALEAEGLLERPIEFLPSSEVMAERARTGAPMARPELAVLLAYAKRSLKLALLMSSLPDEASFERDLREYFPSRVVERFGHLLPEHPLRRELVATAVANDVVDSQGITFVSRAAAETGADAADVARAYRVARAVTGADERWANVEALEGTIDAALQNELLSGVDWVVEKTARWYLQHAPGADVDARIAVDAPGLAELAAHLPTVMLGLPREEAVRRLVARGAPEEMARTHVYQPALVHAPDIVAVAQATGTPIPEVAKAFATMGDDLHLDWLEARLDEVVASSRWERWALNAVEDDLLLVRREAVERALTEAGDDPRGATAAFLEGRPRALGRLDRLVAQLDVEPVHDLSVLTVAVRQARGVIAQAEAPREP